MASGDAYGPAAMSVTLLCLAIAIHDVDGPIHCQTGEKIRLQGIGATETNGTCNPGQPCVPGDPFEQRRRLTKAMGAQASREDRTKDGRLSLYGQLWFERPVRLECEVTGRSHNRSTAWCRLPNGRDLSCTAISIGVAARWGRYDPKGRLLNCGGNSAR